MRPEKSDMSISVMVAAYNEEASIAMVIQEAVMVLDGTGHDYEVLVIDDGSTDTTGAVADDMADRLDRVTVIHHNRNRGLGVCYRTAFDRVRFEYVTVLPGDGEIPASTITAFLASVGDADVVLGFLPEGKFKSDGKPDRRSRFLSGAERMLYRFLFGTFPRFQGTLLFRRQLLDDLPLYSSGRGWMIMVELLIRASRAGYEMIAVPIEMRPRVAGKSKVKNLRMSAIMFLQLVRLRMHMLWER